MTIYGNPEQCEKHPGFYKPTPEYMNHKYTPKDKKTLMSMLKLSEENGK